MKAVITGGAMGLGASFTKYLSSLGYDVILTYNSSYEKAMKLKEMYSNIEVCKLDIRDENAVKEIFNDIKDIDLLINNSAIAIDNEYVDKTKEEFMSVLETNLVGTFLVIKYALNSMKYNSTIVNISSNNALNCFSPISMDYDASKAGVNMLTKDFSVILKDKKIISICPGWINTESIKEMNPNFLKEELTRVNQSNLIDPDELAKYVIDNLENYQNGEIIEIKEL